MKTLLLLSLHKRANFYLEQYEDCENRINDLKHRYGVQLAMPKNSMGRFLIMPESWYQQSIARYENFFNT